MRQVDAWPLTAILNIALLCAFVQHFSTSAGQKAAAPRIIAISVSEAESLRQQGKALFIDARPSESYKEGHISGALSMPLHQSHSVESVPEIDKYPYLVIYCDNEECGASKKLAERLSASSYKGTIVVLTGGWESWKYSGLPTAADAGSTPEK